ncbi:hypothetical protein PENCOP_c012G07992 [Penicillium coprophilum]|uniref:AB hydrolase-1 domain-containing protein n=1 Tax=Penicillium coprophilum TaxID=36646 RepID=A0A1V6UDP8_9EURO|nr:hypothetical protein PENCOP_c012G07992 [Penicillium coprophilum]
MSSEKFTITEHPVPGSHTPQHEGLIPADAITFTAAHGGLYEPLWDELLKDANGFHIRGIWVADVTSMNQSGIQDENKLSMDCSRMDHLFLMINHFREQMSRPLVGIGHSFGGNISSKRPGN